MKILAVNEVSSSQKEFKSIGELKSWLRHRYLSSIILRRWKLYRIVTTRHGFQSKLPMPYGITNMFDFSVFYRV